MKTLRLRAVSFWIRGAKFKIVIHPFETPTLSTLLGTKNWVDFLHLIILGILTSQTITTGHPLVASKGAKLSARAGDQLLTAYELSDVLFKLSTSKK